MVYESAHKWKCKCNPLLAMLPLNQQIQATVETHRLITQGQSVVIAVSGGPDSICLLHVLCNLFDDLSITGVYVDHNLRPDESAIERNLVEAICLQQWVNFVAVSVDVPTEAGATGESIEACARRLRYHALEEERNKAGADIIAVGHTADDQVEEVLLRLIRGSGLKGLSGMRPKRGRVIRPLLEVSRQQVLGYLDEHGLEFCLDSSNESDRFLRNRIRLELLPLLEQRFNPSIRNTILNTSKILEIEEDYLSAESDRLYRSLAESYSPKLDSRNQHSISFIIESLSTTPAALRRRLLERACWEIGCRPDFQHIERIDSLLTDPSSKAELHLPKRVRVLRQHDSLVFTKLSDDQGPRDRLALTPQIHLEIPGPGSYLIAELDRRLEIWFSDEPADQRTMQLDGESVSFPLLLRSVEPGERFTPLGGPGRKKVARFLVDRKVVRHQRHQHPVLESDQGIICILGLEIDESCRITDATTRRLMIAWEPI